MFDGKRKSLMMSANNNPSMILGVDIGGSHITAALVDKDSGELQEGSVRRNEVASLEEASLVVDQWTRALKAAIGSYNEYHLEGIGIAMPGPFDYEQGISLIRGAGKYDQLYRLNIKNLLRSALALDLSVPIRFENDAACFGIGESYEKETGEYKRMIAVTLGTGFGSTFLDDHRVAKQGEHLPPNGELYNYSYLGVTCEDYISGRWLLNTYNQRSEVPAVSVMEMAQRASQQNEIALAVFDEFGFHLAECLCEWIGRFKAECVVIGGSIAKSSQLFLPAFKKQLAAYKIDLPVRISHSMELAAIRGAAAMFR